MRRPQLLYDGLWRCLCPSFDEHALPRALNASFSVRPTASRNGPFPKSSLIQRRQIGIDRVYNHDPPTKAQSLDAFFRLAERQLNKAEPKAEFFKILKLEKPDLENVPAEDIVKALRFLRDGNYHKIPDPHDRIVQFVNFLIVNRNYAPDAFIYECMMDAMTDPKGSAAGVRKLLTDMSDQGIAPTANACYSALSALAVHPDYTLRETVMCLMSTYWYEMTTAAKQDIAIGMLREGQHELALEKFTEMHEGKERMDLWVYDIFIVEFGRAGFLDEMLHLLRQRKHAKGTDNAYRTLLLYALDVFSGAYHEQGTRFVWEYVVTHRILNPPNAMIENVLGTAAHHANTTLASAALDMLSSRGKVPAHQYEALVDVFAAAEDMEGAFGVLAIMERGGTSIQRGMTRSVYQAMAKNPWLITEASEALEKMSVKQEVPLQVIGVTVEAIAKVRGAAAAMDLYHDTFALSGKQPDFDILRSLVLNCTDMETMWSLARDYGIMVAADKPLERDEITLYERMIPACAQFGDFDRAFEHAEKVLGHAGDEATAGEGAGERRGRFEAWVIPLIEHAVAAKDQRVWRIIDEMSKEKEFQADKVQALLGRVQSERRAEKLKGVEDAKDDGTSLESVVRWKEVE
ncbi:pentatricopeptide repeat protein [Thelonectria olida]|uniref:Pentatricopeptide repeat protein n=1 Tax=Thelonectria olida TaxID=1576542 RepID=A0A9P8WB26_9HYPO|nr:pentatricopeptide repeat protein [Thelonectria olida]